MQLKLYLEVHYPTKIHCDLVDTANRCHISVKRLTLSSENVTHSILVTDQCADLAKFGELAGKQNMAIVYYVENPSQSARYNYIPEER